jgi:hypothetical protein
VPSNLPSYKRIGSSQCCYRASRISFLGHPSLGSRDSLVGCPKMFRLGLFPCDCRSLFSPLAHTTIFSEAREWLDSRHTISGCDRRSHRGAPCPSRMSPPAALIVQFHQCLAIRDIYTRLRLSFLFQRTVLVLFPGRFEIG